MTANLFKQGYPYHKIREVFSKFYRRHSELIVKHSIRLKNYVARGHIGELVFYDDSVNKFKRIIQKPNLSNQFKKIIKRYKKNWIYYNGYYATVCMSGFKPNYIFLHDDASGLRLNDGPDGKLSSVGWCLMLVFGWGHYGSS